MTSNSKHKQKAQKHDKLVFQKNRSKMHTYINQYNFGFKRTLAKVLNFKRKGGLQYPTFRGYCRPPLHDRDIKSRSHNRVVTSA